MKVVLIVEYNGSRYRGFQLQVNANTVQGELEKAVERLTGERTRVIAASRTDSGVHARGQVVSFRTEASFPEETWVKAVNFYLPRDIAVRAAYKVADNFDVRRHALSREYRYFILNSPTRSPLRQDFTYLVPQPLDVEAMNQACQAIVGTHDFRPFTPPSGIRMKNTVRTVYKAEFYKQEDLVILVMVANSFLPHQVRHTVGGLIKVGLGKATVEDFREMARSQQPGIIGPAAPPHALCLTRVNYADFPPQLRRTSDENIYS
jgi:tRNA pseudouridine38-40 synthase